MLRYQIFFLSFFFLLPTTGLADTRKSLVKIYSVHNNPDFYNPWSMQGPRSSTGSGAVISGKRILTNAHVVSNSTFIQVRKYGESRKYRASVLSVSHDSDLALLEVSDPEFFKGMKSLKFGGLPETQEEVLVYGFPLGGDQLSITKGVVSRVEHQNYVHSSESLLAIQIDAAINPGNSGGPVISKGSIIGVVMQGIRYADNIGYLVPVPVIKHFLTDIEDGRYDGFPTLGISFQSLENKDLRRYHKVPDDASGILVNKVVPGTAADGLIEEGDVLVSVNNSNIDDDGSVEFRKNERTSMAYFIQKVQVGESLSLSVLRKGETKKLELSLVSALKDRSLVPMELYDVLPSYYIYGGVVFTPLNKSLMKSFGSKWYASAPKDLTALLTSNFKEKKGQEVVLALKVLSSELNEGYSRVSWWPVASVNGVDVINLKQLSELVENSDSEFVVFKDQDGKELVLNRKQVAEKGDEILATYKIPQDRSADLIPEPVPMAR